MNVKEMKDEYKRLKKDWQTQYWMVAFLLVYGGLTWFATSTAMLFGFLVAMSAPVLVMLAADADYAEGIKRLME